MKPPTSPARPPRPPIAVRRAGEHAQRRHERRVVGVLWCALLGCAIVIALAVVFR